MEQGVPNILNYICFTSNGLLEKLTLLSVE